MTPHLGRVLVRRLHEDRPAREQADERVGVVHRGRVVDAEQVDVLAHQVAVGGPFAVVAGFEDDVDGLAERVEQGEEQVEELLAGDGGGEDRHREAVAVAEDADAEAFAGHDRQAGGGADGLGQEEVAVAVHLQVGRQFLGIHGRTLSGVASANPRDPPVADHSLPAANVFCARPTAMSMTSASTELAVGICPAPGPWYSVSPTTSP